MFNNFINRYDFIKLMEKIEDNELGRSFRKFLKKDVNRVRTTWNKLKAPPINWWDIPKVIKRLNEKISGKEDQSHFSYVSQKYLGPREGMKALSLGCGNGENELSWAKTGKFNSIDAFDLSENRIGAAKEKAKNEALDNIVNFTVKNINREDFANNKYDFVILEGSLHHFSPLEKIIKDIANCVNSNGLLVVKDYVGPSRFQWTRRQVAIANGMLALLPDSHKTRWGNQKIKNTIYAPSRLRMIMNDPSEAVESDKILPLLEGHFEREERKDLGGTLLQLLFFEIAHHFLSEDNKTRSLLQICFDIEDLFLENNYIPSDFIFALYRQKN